MKKLINIALICLSAFALNSCMAGKFMSKFALQPEVHGVADIERTRHKADSLMPGSTAWYDSLKAKDILRDTWTTSHDGKKLHACYVSAARPEEAQGTAIVIHGYGDNHFVFLYLVACTATSSTTTCCSPTCSTTVIPRVTRYRWAGSTAST